LLLAVFVCPPVVRGTTLIPCDGFACMYAIHAQDDFMICTMRLSGDTNRYLLAFSTAAGKAAWRRKTGDWVFQVVPGTKGEFFFIDDATLHRCRLSDGSTIDTLNLGSLQWPAFDVPQTRLPGTAERLRQLLAEKPDMTEADKKDLREMIQRVERAGGLKTDFRYYSLVLTPSTLFFWRSVTCWEDGCVRMRMPQWIAVDRATHAVRRAGTSEAFIGKVADDCVLLGDSTESTLLLFDKGQSRVVGQDVLQGRKPWRLYTSFPTPSQTASCHSNQCLIEFRQQVDGGLLSNVNACAVYNGATSSFTCINPEWKPAGQTGWVLHGSNVVQYLQCSPDTNATTLAMESYDMQGNRIARMALPGVNCRQHLVFQGTTSRGDLVFLDDTYYGSEFLGEPNSVTGAVLVVEAPSLAVKARHSLNAGAAPQMQLSCYVPPDTDQIVQVLGNGELYKMEKETQTHPFVIRALDVYSGKERWRIREDAVVRKIK
jgi:hypothetical protein